MWHATVDGGWGGRHGLAGSRTAVALGAKDRERPGRLVRMRTAQAAARAQIPLPRDSDERPDTRDIANVIPDLRPVAGCVGGAGMARRDYEHRSLGTLSPRLDRPADRRGDPARERDARGPNHAGLPGIPGGRYPKGDLMRIVPGDVSAHTPRRRGATCRTSRAASSSCPRPGTAPGRT